jgi:hypothetical protein
MSETFKILKSKPILGLLIGMAIIFIFGFLKPWLSTSNTSYLFGMIEKKPDAKGLLKDYFKSIANNSEDRLIYEPFGRYIYNLDEDFDPSSLMYASREEVYQAEMNAKNWEFSKVAKVIDKMEFISCGEKTIVNDLPGYYCKFLLNNLSGTGLNEKMIEGRSLDYRFSIQIVDGKYYPFNFRD